MIAVAAEARGIDMDAPIPSRKRPADDTMADGITAASGLSFAEALKACAAPPPAKKQKVVVRPMLPSPAAITPPLKITTPASPSSSDSDELFEITWKHTQSRVYSGKKKATDAESANAPAPPTIAALLQGPSRCAYNQVATVLAHCTAAQLERIELLNPGWRKQTDTMWQKICIQQFPKASCTPVDDNSWHSCFKRHTNEADQKLERTKKFNARWRTQTDSFWQKMCQRDFRSVELEPEDGGSWWECHKRHILSNDYELEAYRAKYIKSSLY
uniref:Myb_DNA-bind_3 domain-containing protein n=1 Tax=Panagrellus redivivus TaxID=6233 RepID=A0A7E4UZJ6_PANRE